MLMELDGGVGTCPAFALGHRVQFVDRASERGMLFNDKKQERVDGYACGLSPSIGIEGVLLVITVLGHALCETAGAGIL